MEPRCISTLGGEGSSPHGVQKGQLPWVSSPPAARMRASMCALNRNTGWLGYPRTPTTLPRKEAWGREGGCRRRGSGVSLCGVIHVSLVQGSVPRRQAWAGLSTRLHWDSPRVAPAGEQRYLFFGALQISGARGTRLLRACKSRTRDDHLPCGGGPGLLTYD